MNTTMIKWCIDIELDIPQVVVDGSRKDTRPKHHKSKNTQTMTTMEDTREVVINFIKNVNQEIDSVMKVWNFKRVNPSNANVSELNGGYSTYPRYEFYSEDHVLKLLVEIRISNHESRPDVKQRSETRIHDLQQEEPYRTLVERGIANVEVMDMYCKRSGIKTWIYVATNDKYPDKGVDDSNRFEGLKRIIEGRLSKYIDDYDLYGLKQ